MPDRDRGTGPAPAGPARPGAFARLRELAPEVVEAYEALARATKAAGPLDPVAVALIRLALSVGQRSWRGVHVHARKALEAGATPEAVRQVAVLAVPAVGLHASLDALRWIDEIVAERQGAAGAANTTW